MINSGLMLMEIKNQTERLHIQLHAFQKSSQYITKHMLNNILLKPHSNALVKVWSPCLRAR